MHEGFYLAITLSGIPIASHLTVLLGAVKVRLDGMSEETTFPSFHLLLLAN